MQKEAPPPAQSIVLDKTDVRMVLRDLLPSVGDSQVFFSDERYYLPTKAEIQAILRDSALNNRNFRSELNDCDDFSMALKVEVNAYALNVAAMEVPLCFGIIWAKFDFNSGDPHAVNWFIDQSRALCFVEPQTDEIFGADALVSGVRLILA